MKDLIPRRTSCLRLSYTCTKPSRSALLTRYRSFCWPMAVMQCQDDLEEDVPDLILVNGLTGSNGFADEGTEIAGCAVLVNQSDLATKSRKWAHLHDYVYTLVLRVFDLLNELDDISVFE